MKSWRTLLILVLLMLPSLLWAQHRNPVATQSNCIDLTDLNAPYIHCTYGTFSDPYANNGIASGRHTVITQQAIDSITCSYLCVLHLDKIPPNETYSVKLGNSDVGARAESIAGVGLALYMVFREAQALA